MNLQHKIWLPICRDDWEYLHSWRNFCSGSHNYSWKIFTWDLGRIFTWVLGRVVLLRNFTQVFRGVLGRIYTGVLRRVLRRIFTLVLRRVLGWIFTRVFGRVLGRQSLPSSSSQSLFLYPPPVNVACQRCIFLPPPHCAIVVVIAVPAAWQR
jgi:hypothetical protein